MNTTTNSTTTLSKILALAAAFVAILPDNIQADQKDPLTILVTGANRGLGLEHARQWSAAGHKVIATARRPDAATELKATDAQIVKLDITNDEDIANLVQTLKGQKIDVLINNAATLPRKLDREGMNRCLDVNVTGPFLLTKALIPNLKLSKQPKVVNISSRLGIISSARGIYPAYSISKAALNMATKQLHAQHGRDGFIVISLGPGHNQTDMGGKGAPRKPKDSVAKMIKLITNLDKSKSGKFWYLDGTELPW